MGINLNRDIAHFGRYLPEAYLYAFIIGFALVASATVVYAFFFTQTSSVTITVNTIGEGAFEIIAIVLAFFCAVHVLNKKLHTK